MRWLSHDDVPHTTVRLMLRQPALFINRGMQACMHLRMLGTAGQAVQSYLCKVARLGSSLNAHFYNAIVQHICCDWAGQCMPPQPGKAPGRSSMTNGWEP